jgi:glycosyltransferase involved in cell wall biosynthesis
MTTLHILSNPWGITDPKYRTDAFNIAAHKFIKNMRDYNYDLVHYGHESSVVDCENVPIIMNSEFAPPTDLGHMFLPEDATHLNSIFPSRAQEYLKKRTKPNDIVLSFYGIAYKEVTDPLSDVYVVEPSIGYNAGAVYSNYRAFVSYAWMHYFYGTRQMLMEPSWYDEVIYNAITPEEFDHTQDREDYFLFIGRMIKHKGIDLAIQLTEKLGKQLVIASSGRLTDIGYEKKPSHVIEYGYAGCEERMRLISKAKCLIAPTYYIEPFGNVVAEAAMSGTPVLSTDWGGFVENVNHGVTGFRCKDFNSFLRASEKLNTIKPEDCRKWAIDNFSEKVVHKKFDNWFQKILRNDFYYDEKSGA